jgi:CheY-like chemotaxis protein
MDTRPHAFLIAEDDEDDYLLTLEALKDAGVDNAVHWVRDGEALMEFLARDEIPPIGLIILDLNMPRKDGREALREIKNHPRHRRLPVIVLTTSRAEADVAQSYDLGVNSFIRKPSRFHELVEVFRELSHYWFKTVTLPH